MSSGKLTECPARGFSQQRLRRSRQFLQWRAEFLLPGVAHGDSHIAQKAGVTRPRDGSVAEQGTELILGKSGQSIQRRGEMCGREGRLCRRGRAPVPGAHILADVAAEYM